jgi:hypothetical protein
MPEEKRPLGRFGGRGEDNIKIYLRSMRLCDMDWIHLAQDRDQRKAVVNTVMNRRVPRNVGKFLNSFPIRIQFRGVRLLNEEVLTL